MTAVESTPLGAAFARRVSAGEALAADAEAVARACHDMARRVAVGGKLVVFGSGSAATDAQHLAVEFVHPVIVGKRAFPAISLTGDVATLTGLASRDGVDEVFARQLRLLADPGDIALGLSDAGYRPMMLRRLARGARPRAAHHRSRRRSRRRRPPRRRGSRRRRARRRPARGQGGSRHDLPRAVNWCTSSSSMLAR
jgi:phosphoheptose isomerase